MTPRKEFGPAYIGKELDRLDSALPTRLDVYVAGGYVMANRGLKPGTKDTDVVLDSPSSLRSSWRR